MPQTKRVFSTFRLLYLPFHLFVLFFIGIVEKEVFGKNGASWNGFIFLCSALDIIVCHSIFHDVLLKHRHNECFSLASIALLIGYNLELIIEIVGDVLLNYVSFILKDLQYYFLNVFLNVPVMTIVFLLLWGIITILNLVALILAMISRFKYCILDGLSA